MNPFDMAVVAIMCYCVIRGIFRGFIREISAIAGLVGGFYIAYAHYHDLAPFLGQWISNPTYMNIFSFLVMFTAIFTLVTGLGILVRTLLKTVFLGFVDRFFGAAFGAAKGVALAAALFFLLSIFLPTGGVNMIRQSKTAPAVNRAAGIIVQLVPEGVRIQVENKIKGLKERWEEKENAKPKPPAKGEARVQGTGV